MPKMFFTPDEQKYIYKELMPYEYYSETKYLLNRGNIDDAVK